MEATLKKLPKNTKGITSSNLSSSEEIERKQYDKTPFIGIREKENYYIIMGNYRLTENIGSWEEIEKWIEEITWDKIITITSIVIEITNKNK